MTRTMSATGAARWARRFAVNGNMPLAWRYLNYARRLLGMEPVAPEAWTTPL